MTNPLWVPFTVPGTTPPIQVATGHRSTIVTTDGQELLDFAAGLWNVGFGYDDVGIAQAIQQQMEALLYYPTFRDMTSEVASRLATELIALLELPDAKVILGTGGGSAVETAIKLAKIMRPDGVCVSLTGSYHGTMYGGSAISGQEMMQGRTGAQYGWMQQVPPNDCAAFTELASRTSLAGVFLEPVIGNGCVPLTVEFVDCVLTESRRQGALVIADEVATGFGRTGPLLASASWLHQPDVVLLSKLLTAGALPLSAVVVAPKVWDFFRSNAISLPHGETQGGNTLACAAALAVVRRWAGGFDSENRSRASIFEQWMAARPWGLEAMTGRGFMQSVSLSKAHILADASVEQRGNIVTNMLQAAGLRAYGGGDHLCLFPPLTVSDDELEAAAVIIDQTWKLLG